MPLNFPRSERSARRSSDIRDAYTEEYYRSDCGGHAAFFVDNPLLIRDLRLRTVAAFSDCLKSGRAVDLGCGRGEIAAYLAAQNWSVRAVDYSPAALNIAQDMWHKLRFDESHIVGICADATTLSLDPNSADLVIASDIVEHLAPDELAMLLRKAAKALSAKGLLVIHTFPNLWYYKHEWPRSVARAAALGNVLPADPRSPFEQLMHINEQSPVQMYRSLRRVFEFVDIYVGSPLDPFHAPLFSAQREDLRSQPDIYALASHEPLPDFARTPAFLQAPLPAVARERLRIEIGAHSFRADVGVDGIEIVLVNDSPVAVASVGRFPLHLGIRWFDGNDQEIAVEPQRLPIGPCLVSGKHRSMWLPLNSRPTNAVRCTVVLVQEGVAWFDRA